MHGETTAVFLMIVVTPHQQDKIDSYFEMTNWSVLMNRLTIPTLLLLVLLTACMTEPTPEPTATALPTAIAEATAKPTTMPTTESSTIAPTTETETAKPENNEADLFKIGLVNSQEAIVDVLLPTAPLYDIQLTVSDDLGMITGHEQLRYTNQENTSVDAVYFHLFPNLLGVSIDVEDVMVDGNPVVTTLEEEGDSILRVPLDAPLLPGEVVEIEMMFETAVPIESGRNYGIFANVDGVLAMAHFYPQLAVYDADGWQTAAPSLEGDVTYGDSSFYIVELTAPADQVIVATGVETESTTAGDQQTITYAAGPVRDFYAVMSNDYIKQSQTVGETTINSYAPAAYGTGSAQALASGAAAMEYFSTQYAPYPYTEMDIASTPTLALGVEYPGLFVLTNKIYEDGRYANYLEGTTIHEMGHQWFYNLIGNDQLNEPWLDESLTQYITMRQFENLYGQDGWDNTYNSFDYRWSTVNYEAIPIGQPVSVYEGGNAYSGIIYGRGPIFVAALEEAMGRDVFDDFLRDYFAIYSWDTANTEEFKTLAEEHCGCDLTPLFEEWIY